MGQLNSQLRFNDDGTPRRRYELDQAVEGRAVLTTTIGLVLASAVALIKNVLFPAHSPESVPLPGNASTDVRTSAIESGVGQPDLDSDQGPIRAFDDSAPEGFFPISRSLNKFQAAVDVDQVSNSALRFTPTFSHVASNDNKGLYGAAPGHGVQFGGSDAIHWLPSIAESRNSHASAGDAGGDTLMPGQHVPPHGNQGGDPVADPKPTKLINHAPLVTGPVSLGNRFINQVLVIGLFDLLANASDADGDRLSVSDITPSSGTIVANAEGGWTYMSDLEGQGEVTFSYAVSDGHESVAAAATLILAVADSAATWKASPAPFARIGSSAPASEVRDDFSTTIAEKILLSAATIVGTAGDDVITGTQGNDVIWAGAGNDIVDGGDGDDVIHGEAGNDTLTGGKGHDIVSAGDGDDTIVATNGDGDDAYDGGDGNDALDLTGIVTTHAAQNSQAAMVTADTMPDAAPTSLVTASDVGAAEAVSYPSADVVIDLAAGTAYGDLIGHDTLTGIENVISGGGNDQIGGNEIANTLDGGTGDDVVHGEGGNDILVGGTGNDIVSGNDGDDTIVATICDGNDVYDGGDGDDTLDLTALGEEVAPVALAAPTAIAAPVEAVAPATECAVAATQAVTVIETALVERAPPADAAAPVTEAAAVVPDAAPASPLTLHVAQTATCDTLAAHGDADVAVPATAAQDQHSDTLVHVEAIYPVETAGVHVPSCDVVIDLEAGTVDGDMTGHDHIVNIENVRAGGGDDTILGDQHDNRLEGGVGDDVIDGRAGDDTLNGGAGSDVVHGSDGDDVIVATADAAADVYNGGDGVDTYDASGLTGDTIIDLEEGTVTSPQTGNDTISEIENVLGGTGNDTIIANEAVNIFAGGLGDDTFVFHSTASIGRGLGAHDRILDFAVGDKIDISDISSEFADILDDLYAGQTMRDFVIISELDAFARPGELRVVYDAGADVTMIQGNIDFNADAEFEIELLGRHVLSDSDFHHH